MTQLIDPEISGQFDRLPPHSLESERCALASMMIDPQAVAVVSAIVGAKDFYTTDHQIIFETLMKLDDAGKPTHDIQITFEALKSSGMLEEVGGSEYIGRLYQELPSASHAQHYATIVREKSILRQIIATANQMLRVAYDKINRPADELVMESVSKLSTIIAGKSSSKIYDLAELAQDAYDDLGATESPLISLGYSDLDTIVGGVGPGEMIIVAARPSMGKSTLGRGILWRCAKRGTACGMISLEESRQKIARNILAAECSVENQRLRKKQLSDQDWRELSSGLVRMGGKPAFIADRAFRMNAIRSIAGQMVSQHGVKLIIVDYLQKINADGKDRYEKVTNASLGLSELFKDLNIGGVVMAQLNREAPHRDDKRPTMTDLKESGQIEQDADGIIFLHREDYYHLDDGNYTPSQEAELIIAKWRDGVRGKIVKLRSELKFQRFDDLIPELGGI